MIVRHEATGAHSRLDAMVWMATQCAGGRIGCRPCIPGYGRGQHARSNLQATARGRTAAEPRSDAGGRDAHPAARHAPSASRCAESAAALRGQVKGRGAPPPRIKSNRPRLSPPSPGALHPRRRAGSIWATQRLRDQARRSACVACSRPIRANRRTVCRAAIVDRPGPRSSPAAIYRSLLPRPNFAACIRALFRRAPTRSVASAPSTRAM